MKTNEYAPGDKLLFYRIVALWVVCEGMLGGIIHSVNMPGTGLLVSSGAVICISLLAWYFPVRGVILKATIIVCICKMLLSPHSPPTAYIAVFFQGLMGELLFMSRRAFKLSCMMLAVLALVESAIQRILVLTIIYGSGLWKAIDQFISKLTGDKQITNFSWYIAIGYVLMHLIVGLFIGRFAAKLAANIGVSKKAFAGNASENVELPAKKGSVKTALFLTWLLLLGVYVQSTFRLGKPLLPSSDVLQLIVRSVLIACLWYFIFSPLLTRWMKRWLQKKQYLLKDDVEAIVAMIPATQQLLINSWKSSADEKGLRRFSSFTKTALVQTLSR
jgi:hypothetical protein